MNQYTKVSKFFLALAVGLLLSSIAIINPNADTYINPEYIAICENVGAEFGISPELLESIMEHESSGNRYARNGNCKGLMQVYESVHAQRMAKLGVSDLYDPEGNVRVAASILVELFERSDDCAWVLMSYNGSSDAKRRAESFDFTDYAKSVMARAYELEEIHGKHDIDFSKEQKRK